MSRELGAIAAGLLSVVVLSVALRAVWLLAGLQWAPDQFALPVEGQALRAPNELRWLLPTLAIDAATAAVGGVVTAALARDRRWTTARITTGLLAAGCLVQALNPSEYLPAWLQYARVLIAPAAMYAAARWWLGDYVEPDLLDDPEAAGEPEAAGDPEEAGEPEEAERDGEEAERHDKEPETDVASERVEGKREDDKHGRTDEDSGRSGDAS